MYKIIVVGDLNVGKTSLVNRFAKNSFSNNYKCTTGIDFITRNINVDGKTYEVQLWDTAGQERFRAMVSAYYRDCHGVIFVYDVTRKETFDNILKWMVDFHTYAFPERTGKMLVGTKCDLEKDRVVHDDIAKEYAAERDLLFYETSSKFGINVNDAISDLMREILKLERIETDRNSEVKVRPNSDIKLPNKASEKKSSCC